MSEITAPPGPPATRTEGRTHARQAGPSRRSWAAILATITIAVSLALIPQAAQAATSAANVTLKGGGSGRFLALDSSLSTVQSSTGVHWNITPVPGATQYSRLERTSGKCLDARSLAQGARSTLSDCSTATSQQWSFGSDGSIKNRASGLALDVGGNSTAEGAQVLQWTYWGGKNQLWRIVASAPTTTTPSTTGTQSPTSTVVPTTPPVGNGPLGVPGSWKASFDDEFSGTSIDTSKWTTMEGWTINKVTTHAANLSEGGGVATLTLASSSSGAEICTNPSGGPQYLLPVGSYAEARVYFPGNGSTIYNWPAWWTSGPNWPAAGENDIAEGLGTMTANYHSPSGSHNQGTVPGTWSNAFHVYGMHRMAHRSDVYYDGVKVKSYATDDNGVGESLIINIGQGNTHVYGAASQIKVDWVRAWAPR